MPDYIHKLTTKCHSNSLFQIFNSLNYCMICSAFLFINPSSYYSKLKTIKPDNNCTYDEITPCPLWSLEEESINSINYLNKKDYLKQRSTLIKNIKYICTYFSLSLRTYFLSVQYLDNISSKISFFNPNSLYKISLLCLILAAKMNETAPKVLEVQKELKNDLSKNNYTVDEIYVLKLLNYNLNIYTSYDMLIDILHFGFIFQGEDVNYKNLNFFYYNLEEMLYSFSEKNSFIDMTPKQIAVSFIAFARELSNLEPFSDSIKHIFLINQRNEKLYYSGLELIKKKFKIEKSNNGYKKGKTEGQNTVALIEYKKLVK